MDSHDIKGILGEFAEETTAHALPRVKSSKYLAAKIFWLLVFLIGCGVFVYYTQELVTSFVKQDTITDIKLKFNMLDFPAVTFCNQNRMRIDRSSASLQTLVTYFLQAKKMEMFGGAQKYQTFMDQQMGPQQPQAINQPVTSDTAQNSTGPSQSAPANSGPMARKKRVVSILSDDQQKVMRQLDQFYSEPDVDFANITWFEATGSRSSEQDILLNITATLSAYSKEELMAFGHSIEEMLQECSFQGKICGPSDFYQFYDMMYGNCFTFNSGMDGNVQKVSNPGSSFGLSMTLFINQDAYIPVLSPEAGVRILLHRQGQVPLMAEEGFDVSPGLKSSIAVRYVEVQRIVTASYPCLSANVTQDTEESFYPGNYTQKGCIKTCLQKGIIDRCGCANPLYRKPENVTPCATHHCMEQTELDLLESDECSDQCIPPCWESQYQYVISTSQWPSNAYMPTLSLSLRQRGSDFKRLLLTDPRSGLSENFLKLNIFYDNLNFYQYSERLAMTESDLVGAIGGHVGLWLGMSMISLLEIFELLMHLILYCIRGRQQNSKTGSMDSKTGSTDNLTEKPGRRELTPVERISLDSDSPKLSNDC